MMDHPMDQMNEIQYISQFALEHLIVKDIDLSTPFVINRSFTTFSNVFDGTHLFVPNEGIRKKLLYSLLQEYRTNHLLLTRYGNEPLMRHYYMYSNDFRVYPNHHMLKSEQSYLLYIKQHDTVLPRGVQSIQPNAILPYLLYKSIPGFPYTRYIMQPVRTLSQADAIFTTWMSKQIHIFPKEDYQAVDNNKPWNWIIWKNEHDVEVKPITEGAPLLSIVNMQQIHDTEHKAFVHVMLPFF